MYEIFLCYGFQYVIIIIAEMHYTAPQSRQLPQSLDDSHGNARFIDLAIDTEIEPRSRGLKLYSAIHTLRIILDRTPFLR